MAMVIVVNDTKNHTVYEDDIFKASAKAVINLLGSDDLSVQESINSWLTGRIRKIVKRARNKAWDDTHSTEQKFSEATHASATVRVFAPMHFSDMPQPLKKLQVAGLEAEKTESNETLQNGLNIFIEKSLQMSTGKTVAQVNHVVQLFLMNGEEEKVNEWISNEFPVRFAFSETLDSYESDIIVRDAGFTEIPSGSRTAIGVYL